MQSVFVSISIIFAHLFLQILNRNLNDVFLFQVFVALFISVSQAGVGVLSPQDEANALQLFHSMCAQGGGGGDYGEYRVWCKSSGQDYQEEVLTHQVHVPQGAATPGQIVFVQAPPISYRHNIQLSGAPGGQQSSKIYVLPQKATHSIEATYRPGGNPGSAKPQVFFLNKNFAGQNQQVRFLIDC